MNRYEVLDIFNKTLIIPLGIIGTMSAVLFVIHWGDLKLAVLSVVCFALIACIISQFNKLTMLIHNKYIEEQKINDAKAWWSKQ